MSIDRWIAVGVVSALVMGCAAEEASSHDGEAAPSEDADGIGESAVITSVNADGTWTAQANAPTGLCQINGFKWTTSSATFTGPSGKTRKMGSCLLLKWTSPTSPYAPKTCSTVADCASAPSTLGTGGARYCTNENGTGQKYCFYRLGAQATWCDGSPALGGSPVAPGTYSVTYSGACISPSITYACFEGCSATDPSVSSVTYATPQP